MLNAELLEGGILWAPLCRYDEDGTGLGVRLWIDWLNPTGKKPLVLTSSYTLDNDRKIIDRKVIEREVVWPGKSYTEEVILRKEDGFLQPDQIYLAACVTNEHNYTLWVETLSLIKMKEAGFFLRDGR